MLSLLLLFAVAVFYIISFYRNVRRYPKGPLPLPLIGNLYHLRPHNLHEQLHELSAEHGSCYTLFLPRPTVIFTEYSVIKEALVTQGEHFAGRLHGPPDSLFLATPQTGVLLSDGPVWQRQRRVALRIMRDFGVGRTLIEEKINRSLDELLNELKNVNSAKPVDLNLPIQLCVGNVINEILFGFHYKYTDTARFEYFIDVLNQHLKMVKDGFSVFLVQAWPWLRHVPILGYYGYDAMVENIQKYHVFIEDQVREQTEEYEKNGREEEEEPANFVHAYLKEKKKDVDGELDVPNLVQICLDFWLAGMETTSTTLRWSLLYLMKHPDVQEEMASEIASVLGAPSSTSRPVALSDRPSLPFTNAVILEIQRACNMVPFLGFHRSTRDTVIAGHKIPADTLTMPQIHAVLAHDEAFEAAEEFRPRRFLAEDGKTMRKDVIERLVQFGMGKRQCVGEGLARAELFLILTTLVHRYRFTPNGLIDMTPVFSTVLAPKPYDCYVSTRK